MFRNNIEIGGHTMSPLGKRLSNFYARAFVMDGVRCAGFEGFVQSLKCADLVRQRQICGLTGAEAKKAGKPFNSWKTTQDLYWNKSVYKRTSRDYMLLITRVYDAIYEQNPDFREDLLALGNADIWHSIGNPDMSNTTLTEVEMLWQLERLRRRALQESMQTLLTPHEQ
jgi:hypothetical protein